MCISLLRIFISHTLNWVYVVLTDGHLTHTQSSTKILLLGHSLELSALPDNLPSTGKKNLTDILTRIWEKPFWNSRQMVSRLSRPEICKWGLWPREGSWPGSLREHGKGLNFCKNVHCKKKKIQKPVPATSFKKKLRPMWSILLLFYFYFFFTFPRDGQFSSHKRSL